MKLLMTASQIRGLPVVTIRGGEDVAEVRDVIYSPEAGRLVGMTLNQRGFLSGRRREVLPADMIHAVGQDAVMVTDESQLVVPEAAPEDVGHPATERNVLGNDVLTEGGTSLGEVADLVLLVGSGGEVVGYQVKKPGGGHGYIPLPAQLAVSGDAPVVPDVTAEFVQEDLVGLGAAVDEFQRQARSDMSESFRDSLGRKVVSRASAQELGAVNHLLVDDQQRQVSVVVIGKGKKAQFVDWTSLSGFGPDAVMVEDESSLRVAADERERAAADGKLELVGKRSLTELGNELGPIDDVTFDAASGALEDLVIGARRVRLGRCWAAAPMPRCSTRAKNPSRTRCNAQPVAATK